jgi:acetyltransferase-like isoleucine patch superfamily enzyme
MIKYINLFKRLGSRSAFGALVDRVCYFSVQNIGLLWKFELMLRGAGSWLSLRSMTVLGRPIVSMAIGSKVEFGRNVVLMSSNRFCLSSSLYAPCKIKCIYATAKILIGDDVSLNGTSIVCRSTKITIGARTMIGPNVTIMDSSFHYLWPLNVRNKYSTVELDKPIEIGEDVWIGSQVIILPGSKIGAGSVIGAGSIVVGEIPSNSLAVGSPAKIAKKIDAI